MCCFEGEDSLLQCISKLGKLMDGRRLEGRAVKATTAHCNNVARYIFRIVAFHGFIDMDWNHDLLEGDYATND